MIQFILGRTRMLKFLQEGRHQKQRKTLINFKPAMVYGHTRESSPHMINSHTVYYPSQMNTLPSIKPQPMISSFSKVCKLSNGEVNDPLRHQQQRLSEGNGPSFKLQKGEFTTFADRHKHYKSIGQLHRANKRVQPNRAMMSTNWNKSTHTGSKSYAINPQKYIREDFRPIKDVNNTDSMASTDSGFFNRSSSVSLISNPTRERLKIKDNRQIFAQNARKEYELRKMARTEKFRLPNKGPQHQIFFVKKYNFLSNQNTERQADQLNNDIEYFESKTNWKHRMDKI